MSVMSILLLCGAAKPESGILHLVNDTIDLGDVPRDSVAAAPLLVTNTGTAPFVITSVRTNCSCSVGSYPHSEIMPGGHRRDHNKILGPGQTSGPSSQVYIYQIHIFGASKRGFPESQRDLTGGAVSTPVIPGSGRSRTA